MHLIINQDVNSTERVDGSVITKLYNLARGGEIDETSVLRGTLLADTASRKQIDYLEELFENLHITATTYSISFEDPEVERVCIQNFGSNGGVTENQLNVVSNIGDAFKDNTTITKFNEFAYFTGLDSTNWGWFAGCTNLEEITLPRQITRINAYGFQNCSSLTTINLDRIEYIDQYGLQRCSSITSLVFNAGINLGPEACGQMTSLTSVEFKGDVTGSKYNIFKDCSQLSTVIFDGTVTNLPGSIFSGRSTIQSIDLSNVTGYSTDGYQFHSCSALTSVTLNSSLTSLPRNLFSYCGAMTITIPATVTSIGDECFKNTSLISLTVLATTPPTLGTQSIEAGRVSVCYVPSSALSAYQSASGWSDFAAKIQAIA